MIILEMLKDDSSSFQKEIDLLTNHQDTKTYQAFLNENSINDVNSLTVPKRRTKAQIKSLIMDALSIDSISTNELYKRLGYSGNASKTFRSCIEELIDEGKVRYAAENKQDSQNVLMKVL